MNTTTIAQNYNASLVSCRVYNFAGESFTNWTDSAASMHIWRDDDSVSIEAIRGWQWLSFLKARLGL